MSSTPATAAPPRCRRRRGRCRACGIGIIITPDALRLACVRRRSSPSACRRRSSSERLGSDLDLSLAERLLTGRPSRSDRSEAQRAGAEAADRPRGDLEHEHAGRRLTRHSAWIGPWRRPSAAAAACHAVDDRALASRRSPRRASGRSSPRRTGRRAGRACRRSPAPAARRDASALRPRTRGRG